MFSRISILRAICSSISLIDLLPIPIGNIIRCNWLEQFSLLCTSPNNHTHESTELRFLLFDHAEPLLPALLYSSPAKHPFCTISTISVDRPNPWGKMKGPKLCAMCGAGWFTCKISEDIKLLAICRSLCFNGTIDCSDISCKSSPRSPNHFTLQAKCIRH
jgi:hypothetical protein